MDFRRIILFGALGLVLVMIWQSWTQYQIDHGRSGTNAVNQQGADSDVPTAADLAEEVPDAPEVAANAVTPTAIATDQPADGASGEIIHILTDLYRVEIDSHGGDIVRVELLKHPLSVDTPDDPLVLMHRSNFALHVAQSGLIGTDRSYPDHRTEFTAEQTQLDLGAGESVSAVLNWTADDGVQYRKIFTFHRDSYKIDITFEVDNQTATDWAGFFYGQLKQTEIQQEGSMGILGQLPSYNGAAIYTEEDKYDKVDYSDIQDAPLKVSTPNGWVAMLQHYFVSAWLPTGAQSYQFYSGVSNNTSTPQYRIGYKQADPVRIAAGSQGVVNSSIFIGPKNQKRLENLGVPGILLTVDYGWLTPVADPLFWLLTNIQSFVKNWGWSIILLTLLIKIIFLPLSAASYKSMAKMKKLQPRLKTLKERYGDDKQKFQQEMMKLYKTEKVNPAGGCLPILIQIPVFIALYWVLLESVELRQADFMWWLNDLSLPDPYYVLPIIMGASMLVQQMLNPAPMDPMQKKIMTALPVVFTVFFLWFPAGLVLYWVVNNLLSIAQQYFITKKYAD